MKIDLITPAPATSRAGNRVTAERWSLRLEELGHRVRVLTELEIDAPDLLIALHAWRSANATRQYRDQFETRPLIVALTGTDIYRFLETERATTLASMDRGDLLIGLHDRVRDAIPAAYHDRLHIIHQSALPLDARVADSSGAFEVCVIGHLREEKDPFRAAEAVRDLPAESTLQIVHVGAAKEPTWAEAAQAEMARNARYAWRGEVPSDAVRDLFSRTRLMVLSSIMEGGANVLSEAIVGGVPVIASDIPGNIGLLGIDYMGYYPVGNTAALRELLLRAERDADYLESLRAQMAALEPRFTVNAERAGWQAALDALRLEA